MKGSGGTQIRPPDPPESHFERLRMCLFDQVCGFLSYKVGGVRGGLTFVTKKSFFKGFPNTFVQYLYWQISMILQICPYNYHDL